MKTDRPVRVALEVRQTSGSEGALLLLSITTKQFKVAVSCALDAGPGNERRNVQRMRHAWKAARHDFRRRVRKEALQV